MHSTNRRIIFGIGLAGILLPSVILVAEAIGRVAYHEVTGRWYSSEEFRQQMLAVETPAAQDRKEDPTSVPADWPEILHPYLGFVQRRTGDKSRIDSFGFPVNLEDPIHESSASGLVIGIFGGSFAQGIATHHERMAEAVAKANRDPVIVNTAMGGYKQPQQLLALCYLLTLDAHFDAVVNIDGFNEVALPPVENTPKDVFPFYPRNWYFRSLSVPGENLQLLLGETQYLRRIRSDWSSIMNRRYLLRSFCWFAVWKSRERELSSRINRLQLAMMELETGRSDDPSVSGPVFKKCTLPVLAEALAAHWANCSRLMDDICRANGIRYYHYLQPNQYVPDTRNLTPMEMKKAFDPDHPYRQGVLDGYPHLIRFGKNLAASGMVFTDLTKVYSDVSEEVYRDTCCHPGPEGYELIGAIIGERIRSDFSGIAPEEAGLTPAGPTTGSGGREGRLHPVMTPIERRRTPRQKDLPGRPGINKKLSAN